jgi:lipopolysaccharide biosynthesis protein
MIRLPRLVLQWLLSTLVPLHYPFALIGSCIAIFIPRVRAVTDGAEPAPQSRRYAVYATYDRYGLISDYIVEQVAVLAGLGYRVIFVSASPRLPDEQVMKVRQHCWKLVHRRNFGHDFGSYKCGIQQIAAPEDVQSLILMNDSCYGPLFDLSDIVQRAQSGGADILGITDSWQHKYHLQSYFLHLSGRAVRSRAFRYFWATLLPYQSRALTVRHGEVRFTQLMVRNGITTDALCPYRAVAQLAQQLIMTRTNDEASLLLPNEKRYLEALARQISQGIPLNPTHSFWDVMIVEFGCPFIKRDLLKRNPARIPGVSEWSSLLSVHTAYDTGRIERHLKIG